MARDLGVYASTIHGAVAPALAVATHATPKLFIASLRGLQALGLPFQGAAALLAIGCALFAFLAIWLAFRGIANVVSALAKGAAAVAGAAKGSRAKIELPQPSVDELQPRAAALAAQPPAREPDEPFIPLWDPSGAADPVMTGSPGSMAAAPAAGLPPPIPIRRAASRPTPASVAAAAGILPRPADLADLTDPLGHEDVPPGFLFIDTSPAEPSPAEPSAAERAIARPAIAS